jgi:hypothetical protein
MNGEWDEESQGEPAEREWVTDESGTPRSWLANNWPAWGTPPWRTPVPLALVLVVIGLIIGLVVRYGFHYHSLR